MANRASGIFPSDEWQLSQAAAEGEPTFARFRANLPKEDDRKKFPTLMVVRWKFPPKGSTAVVSPNTHKLMDEFEDRIVSVSNAQREWGACAVVLTARDFKEWRFYAPSDAAFIEGFNAALEGSAPYPLTIEAFQDPDWNGLIEFQRNQG